jgi:hypothetical protein
MASCTVELKSTGANLLKVLFHIKIGKASEIMYGIIKNPQNL